MRYISLILFLVSLSFSATSTLPTVKTNIGSVDSGFYMSHRQTGGQYGNGYWGIVRKQNPNYPVDITMLYRIVVYNFGPTTCDTLKKWTDQDSVGSGILCRGDKDLQLFYGKKGMTFLVRHDSLVAIERTRIFTYYGGTFTLNMTINSKCDIQYAQDSTLFYLKPDSSFYKFYFNSSGVACTTKVSDHPNIDTLNYYMQWTHTIHSDNLTFTYTIGQDSMYTDTTHAGYIYLMVSKSDLYDYRYDYWHISYFDPSFQLLWWVAPFRYNFYLHNKDSVYAKTKYNIYLYQLNHTPLFNNYQLLNNVDSFFHHKSIVDSVAYSNTATQQINYTKTFSVTDDNFNAAVKYTKFSGPSWINIQDSILTVNSTGILEGVYICSVMVRDTFSTTSSLNLADTVALILTIYSKKINITTSSFDTTATEKSPYSQTINLTDRDNNTGYVNSKTLPSWLTISRVSPMSFLLQGTPGNVNNDTAVYVLFTDSTTGNFTYDTLQYNIHITHVNDIPIIANMPHDTSIKDVDSITYNLIVNDSDDVSHTITWYKNGTSNGTGLSYKFKDNTIGPYNIKIGIADNDTTIYDSFTVNVSHDNYVPSITSVFHDTTIKELDSIPYTVNFTDLDDVSHVIHWWVGTAMTNIGNTYNYTTNYNTVVIGTQRTYAFTVVVSDGKDSSSKTWNVTVLDNNRKPIFTNTDTALHIIEGANSLFTLHAIDPDTRDTVKVLSHSIYDSISGTDSVFTIYGKTISVDTIKFYAIDNHGDTGIYELKVVVEGSSKLEKAIPINNYVLQNCPNPFNPSTTIRYGLKEKSQVAIRVYNILGKQMTTLVNETQNAGHYNLNWMAHNIPSGRYIYSIKIGNKFSTRKIMTVVK